jgi:hypothetical protein
MLTLAMIALWIAAMVDISAHRSRGTFTSVGLVCMAAAVTVAAVIAVAGIGAVFGGRWSEAVSSATSDGTRTNGQEVVLARAYLFSFGLENASNVTPADPTSANQRR